MCGKPDLIHPSCLKDAISLTCNSGFVKRIFGNIFLPGLKKAFREEKRLMVLPGL
jgi:hypothetical protein